MTGHTSQRRWRSNQTQTSGKGLSEEITQLSIMLLDVLYKAEQLGMELEELQEYLGDNSAQTIADQLFKEDWTMREADPLENPGVFEECANAEEVAMVEDAVTAVEAAKEIFDFANKKAKEPKMKAVKKEKSRIQKLRRMA